MKSLWRNFKNSKTTRDAYLGQVLYKNVHVTIAQSIWWPGPFNSKSYSNPRIIYLLYVS